MPNSASERTTESGPVVAGQAEARIDLGAIRSNVGELVRRASGAAVMGVVKADGYGHGMVPAARAMLAGGATWLGTAFVDEALAVRAAGITAPTVAWIVPPGTPLDQAVAADIDLGISVIASIDDAAEAARRVGRPARVHLKADTGLARGGISPRDWAHAVEAAADAERAGHVRVVGVFSHFACADEPGHPSIARQLDAFQLALKTAEKGGLRPEVRHLANSAATLTLPESHYDLVRPGIAAYGLHPIPELDDGALRPAMTLSAPLMLTRSIDTGQGVSYGYRFVAEHPTRLGLVPLGYADGVPRAATNTAEVSVNGARFPIAGTVCMDQFCVDLGDQPVEAGDRVTLFGPGEQGEPTAQEWADRLGTIHYELVTRVGGRVARRYVGG
ncbi:alanine racemase [Spiractinospora alimapuensis]|uniref:alanine racemase n=1 Tax=Spiractinospora alimapuensis TaxID=2820884 RepID=UPI001EECDD1A|nr:alanine racemase [Spiractinospora alimapuensis]QVQ51086.1 alanine racemase [Spiractinospora alimapuensis]